MIKHASVSNDVMSKLSDIRMYLILIVLNDFVSLKNSFFMSLKIILTCVHEMLCYFTETKADTNYTCNLLFFSFGPRR